MIGKCFLDALYKESSLGHCKLNVANGHHRSQRSLSGPNSWFYPSFMNNMRISWLLSVGLPNNFKGCDSFFWNTDSSWGGLKNGRWERKLLSWEVWVSTSNMRLSSLKGQHYTYMDALYKIKATMCVCCYSLPSTHCLPSTFATHLIHLYFLFML